MTPVSLNPPPHSFPLTAEDQIQDHENELFIFPNSSLDSTTSSLSCRSFFNVLDQTQTREIRELTHDQQEDGVALHSGSSSTEAGMDDRSQVCGHNSSAMYRREEDESKSKSKSGYDSAKWMSSKMRLMRKMMTPNSTPHTPKPSNTNTHDIPTFQTHDHENTHRINSTTRVCADCNTTTTPLWRGGPKGPKSLCNACGIRQRKARRASMAEGANGGSSYSRVNKKEKKPRANHFVQFKNKWKGTSSTSGGGMTSQGSERAKNIGLKDFAFGFSNSSASAVDHQVFPRDEVAEAALLLMDLSCAFLPI